ncbi:protein phosphatase 2C domain-containing protein [Streptomyces sp. NPDC048481]|uniref:protein phosphatase 2C domain-containing protein n=1 Tax=Streptomyces sp. NPDC048481 TaxID=3365557 RepID=UPI00372389B9
MSQQGGRPTGREDDWWRQLYDDATEDTGPAPAADSLDDRFASAAGAVRTTNATDGTTGDATGDAVDGADDGRPASGPAGALPSPRAERSGAEARADWWTPQGPPPTPPSPPPVPRKATVPQPRTGPPAAPAPPDAGPVGGPDRQGGGGGVGGGLRPEPPSDGAAGPTGFPPGPLPPGFAEQPFHGDGYGDVHGASASASASAPASADDGDAPAWTEAADPRRPESPPPSPPSPAADPARRPPPPPRPPSPPQTPPEAPRTAGPRSAAAPVVPPAPDAPPDPRAPAPPGTPAPASAPAVPPAAPPPVPPHAPPPPTAPTAHTDGRSPSFTPAGAAPYAPARSPEPGPDTEAEPAPPGHPPTVLTIPAPPAATDHVGSGPPTYDAEPTALPAADPDELDDLVADTVLEGARYGSWALRAASVRGDSARYRGEPRRDSLLTARFGTGEHALVLVAMATGARATPGAHRAAAEVCRWIGRAVGRSHVRLAEDIRASRRGDLKSGLHRLTDRSLGRLRAGAAEQGLEPEEYAATLRCLLLPADPECRTRVFFGVGGGGLFRLRGGVWRDIEPQVSEVAGDPVVGFGSRPAETPEGDRLTMDLGVPTPPDPYDPEPGPPREPFRFRASVARPGDTLLMCTGGMADPLRGEPELSAHLTERWSDPAPPGLAAFLADTQVRVKGYADDRTAAAVWEA